MKRTLTLLLLISTFSFYAKAQDAEPKEYVKSYLQLNGGISNPIGDFGRTNFDSNNSGFAKRGVTLGLDGACYIYKNLAIGGDFSFNDQGELTSNDAQIIASGYNAAFKTNYTSVQGVNRYHNITLLLGPQYSFAYHKFILDLRASAGVIKSLSTPIITTYLDGTGTIETTVTQEKSTATAFAYSGTAGLRWQFADGWDIGVRFNYLDTKGINITTRGDITDLKNDDTRLVSKTPITVIQSTFGIAVHF